MSKKSPIFSVSGGKIKFEGTFKEIAEYFNADIISVRNRYYASGSYGGCKFLEIGYELENNIWGAVKGGEVEMEGTLEELAEKLGCAVKTIQDTRKYKEYTFRKLRRESERIYYF